MNKVTICKYSEMKHIALSVGSALQDLSEKCKRLFSFCANAVTLLLVDKKSIMM